MSAYFHTFALLISKKQQQPNIKTSFINWRIEKYFDGGT